MNWYKKITSNTPQNNIKEVDTEQPLAGSISRNGKKIYIDTDIPKKAKIDGKIIDLHKALIIHEEAEKIWMNKGLSQAKSHLKALEQEHNYVRECGIDPISYEKYMDLLISKAEKHPKSECPKDIDPRQKPVIDKDEPETIPSDYKNKTPIASDNSFMEKFYSQEKPKFIHEGNFYYPEKMDIKDVEKVKKIAKDISIPLEGIGYGDKSAFDKEKFPHNFGVNLDSHGIPKNYYKFKSALEKEFPDRDINITYHR